MTDEMKWESMDALKKFADYKNQYKDRPESADFNGTVVDGKLYEGDKNKTLFKDDAQFAIQWTDRKAEFSFVNMHFRDMGNKSVLSSDEYSFAFHEDKLEFTAGGSHWTLE